MFFTREFVVPEWPDIDPMLDSGPGVDRVLDPPCTGPYEMGILVTYKMTFMGGHFIKITVLPKIGISTKKPTSCGKLFHKKVGLAPVYIL